MKTMLAFKREPGGTNKALGQAGWPAVPTLPTLMFHTKVGTVKTSKSLLHWLRKFSTTINGQFLPYGFEFSDNGFWTTCTVENLCWPSRKNIWSVTLHFLHMRAFATIVRFSTVSHVSQWKHESWLYCWQNQGRSFCLGELLDGPGFACLFSFCFGRVACVSHLWWG